MEWWKAERESTNPSTRVTVTQTSIPSPRAWIMRLAAGPWKKIWAPERAEPVGVTYGWAARLEAGGEDVGLAVDGEPDVADDSLVEDGVDLGLVVHAALREAAHGGASGGRESVHGLSTVAAGGRETGGRESSDNTGSISRGQTWYSHPNFRQTAPEIGWLSRFAASVRPLTRRPIDQE